MFDPELIRINWLIDLLIKTARSAVSKNRAVFFFAASAAKFWKHDNSSASEKAFPGVFDDIFGCSTLSKKRCFSAEEFTRFLSTVSSQRRATRYVVSFQQGDLSAWSLFSWHPTHKYLWGRLCFVQVCCLISNKAFIIWYFRYYCLVQIVSLWPHSIAVRIIFTTNVLVDRIKNLIWNASPND